MPGIAVLAVPYRIASGMIRSANPLAVSVLSDVTPQRQTLSFAPDIGVPSKPPDKPSARAAAVVERFSRGSRPGFPLSPQDSHANTH